MKPEIAFEFETKIDTVAKKAEELHLLVQRFTY